MPSRRSITGGFKARCSVNDPPEPGRPSARRGTTRALLNRHLQFHHLCIACPLAILGTLTLTLSALRLHVAGRVAARSPSVLDLSSSASGAVLLLQ